MKDAETILDELRALRRKGTAADEKWIPAVNAAGVH